ncbi:hypothetical protein TOTORO_03300 [Serratia phage vB_SmaS-Totoro]|nr:hypothetical protein TOTORO_03300 [Serratia phage vB_SmaS-Totoro]
MENKEILITVGERVIRFKQPGKVEVDDFIRRVSKEIRQGMIRKAGLGNTEALMKQLPDYLRKYYEETGDYNYGMLSSFYNLSLYVIPLEGTVSNVVELNPVKKTLGACKGYIEYRGQRTPFILLEDDDFEGAVVKVHRRLATKIREGNFPEDIMMVDAGVALDAVRDILGYFLKDGERGSTIDHPHDITIFIE